MIILSIRVVEVYRRGLRDIKSIFTEDVRFF